MIQDSLMQIYSPIYQFILKAFIFIFFVTFIFLFSYFFFFFLYFRINPFKLKLSNYRCLLYKTCFIKTYDFFRWVYYDFLHNNRKKKVFSEYGVSLYCGEQGSGKTISMVKYLYDMKCKYPNVKICTNFSCVLSDYRMESWQDLCILRNGTDGIIFAIDEIQNEFNSTKWKDFPDFILSEISMQRKQRVKIVATSQVFTRVAKPIREHTFYVVNCSTFLNRWTKNVTYFARDYFLNSDNVLNVDKKSKKRNKSSFIQSNFFRSLYDTNEKIKKIDIDTYVTRSERID